MKKPTGDQNTGNPCYVVMLYPIYNNLKEVRQCTKETFGLQQTNFQGEC